MADSFDEQFNDSGYENYTYENAKEEDNTVNEREGGLIGRSIGWKDLEDNRIDPNPLER